MPPKKATSKKKAVKKTMGEPMSRILVEHFKDKNGKCGSLISFKKMSKDATREDLLHSMVNLLDFIKSNTLMAELFSEAIDISNKAEMDEIMENLAGENKKKAKKSSKKK